MELQQLLEKPINTIPLEEITLDSIAAVIKDLSARSHVLVLGINQFLRFQGCKDEGYYTNHFDGSACISSLRAGHIGTLLGVEVVTDAFAEKRFLDDEVCSIKVFDKDRVDQFVKMNRKPR